MSQQWADEIDGTEPDPKLEFFFLACMLKFGKFENMRGDEIYKYIVEFHNNLGVPIPVWNGNTLPIQYMLWYERQKKVPECPF